MQKQERENRIIAAICAAPVALKAHGIAKGRRITSYPTVKDELIDCYEYADNSVVVDGTNNFY